MKFSLLFVLVGCFVGIAFCGNVKWSLSKEEDALSLYRKYCNGNVKEGEHGNTRWYCKSPEDEQEPVMVKPIEHVFQILINSTKNPTKDVIFVQTPPKKYEHKIFVTGKYAVNKDTDIYVVPSGNQHIVNVQSDIQLKLNNESNKPKTLYLEKNPITFRLPVNVPPTEAPLPFGPPFIARSPQNDFPIKEDLGSNSEVHNHGRIVQLADIN